MGIEAGRHGAERAASVGPYSPTTGVSVAAAMCSGPVSPPTKSRLRPISALSSSRSNSPRSMIRCASAPSRARVAAAIREAASRSDGPELSTSRRCRIPRRQGGGRVHEELFRPAPERVPCAHVHHHQFVVLCHAGLAAASPPCARRPADPARCRCDPAPGPARRPAIPEWPRAGPTGSAPNAAAAAHARVGRCACTSSGDPGCRTRSVPWRRSPMPATHCAARRADPARGRTSPRRSRRARFRSSSSRPRPASSRRHDHLVEVPVAPHDRRRRRLHEIRQPRPRIRAAQRADQSAS